jgi:hypothetical protein
MMAFLRGLMILEVQKSRRLDNFNQFIHRTVQIISRLQTASFHSIINPPAIIPTTKSKRRPTPVFDDHGETTFPSLVALLAAVAALPAIELRDALAAEAALPLKVAKTLEMLDSTTLALELTALANELADEAAELVLDAITEKLDSLLAPIDVLPTGSAAAPPSPPPATRTSVVVWENAKGANKRKVRAVSRMIEPFRGL